MKLIFTQRICVALVAFFCVNILLLDGADDPKDLTSSDVDVLERYGKIANRYIDSAWAYHESNTPLGKVYADSSLQYARLSQDSFLVSLAYNILGRVAGVEVRPQLALDYYLKAFQIRQQLFEEAVDQGNEDEIERLHLSVAGSCMNLGNGYRNLGAYPNSITYLKKAQEIYAQYQLEPKMIRAQKNLAITYGKSGDVSTSIELFGEVIQFYPQQDMPYELAKALLASAQAHMEFYL